MRATEERLAALKAWGREISNIGEEGIADLGKEAHLRNPWFTPEMVATAVKGLQQYLAPQNLDKWISMYDFSKPLQPKRVGVIMAGNIPLVGIHDYLSVLMSGHYLAAKLSAKDEFLMKWAHGLLVEIAPDLAARVSFPERLTDIDAIIATGSNNSGRYFEYYFGKMPHIIRRNRSSCAILTGSETPDDLLALASDVFLYYGLGCRSVSMLYVPEDYDFTEMLTLWLPIGNEAMNNHKYANNYEYGRATYLINSIPHLDNGSILLREFDALSSPVAILHTKPYTSTTSLAEEISSLKQDQLQCVTTKEGWYPGSFHFGEAQKPHLWDYADEVDTLQFLLSLR